MASRMGPGCFAVKFTYYHTGISGAFIIQQHWLHPLSLLSAANRPFDAYWPLRWPELVESPQFQTCWLATMLHPEFRGQTFLISLSGEKRFCLLVVKLIQVCKVHDIFFRSFSRALSNVNKIWISIFLSVESFVESAALLLERADHLLHSSILLWKCWQNHLPLSSPFQVGQVLGQ